MKQSHLGSCPSENTKVQRRIKNTRALSSLRKNLRPWLILLTHNALSAARQL